MGERFLLIRPGAIGDALLTFPVLQQLQAYHPGAHILFVSNPAVVPLARAWRLADEVANYGEPFWSELFLSPKKHSRGMRDLLQNTDHAICWLRDPDDMLKQSLQAYPSIKRISIAPGRPPEGVRMPIVEYLLQTIGLPVDMPFVPVGAGVAEVGGGDVCVAHPRADIVTSGHCAMDSVVGDASVPSSHLSHPRPYDFPEILPTFSKPTPAPTGIRGNTDETPIIKPIVIHPGSGGVQKCWPVTHFATIIQHLWQRALPVLLLAGPADSERLSDLLHRICPPPHPSLLAMLIDAPLLEVAAYVQHSRGYLGNDSGITHLAALLGVPTIALFGPSDPLIWHPMGPSVHVLSEPILTNIQTDTVMHAIDAFIL